ncbi:DUF3298 domain-containing protein [Acinetobacter sp. ASP199]|uniref:DUF3298 domain-containing protein n=1 Tax=unclassified Acinetobacter TaxID=196816 RepID=UPI001F606323|nr:DUF3298 domain-containing protein [Acinetobacter sp. ASP199]UNT58572.1 DUF3298 domain-containing protein [Acinetobacter sp. ASP199]
MKITSFKTGWIVCILCLNVGLFACQPQTSSVNASAQTEEAGQIQSKTIPVKGSNEIVCEAEACVRFDLQTVDTNISWIDQYFIERIQRTEPVVFNKVTSHKAKDQPKFFEQRSIQVSYLNQYGHLATFIFKTVHQPERAAQPQSHIEYVNLDLKQKKRLALYQIMRGNTEEKLIQALYRENQDWLDRAQVTSKQLGLSDNYYFDSQGLVLVYPAGELSKSTSAMAELKVPYTALSEIIRPEYLSVLPKTTP